MVHREALPWFILGETDRTTVTLKFQDAIVILQRDPIDSDQSRLSTLLSFRHLLPFRRLFRRASIRT